MEITPLYEVERGGGEYVLDTRTDLPVDEGILG
jgi:hypothetical protein